MSFLWGIKYLTQDSRLKTEDDGGHGGHEEGDGEAQGPHRLPGGGASKDQTRHGRNLETPPCSPQPHLGTTVTTMQALILTKEDYFSLVI